MLALAQAWSTTRVSASTAPDRDIDDFISRDMLGFKVYQLPHLPRHGWMALSDKEQRRGLDDQAVKDLDEELRKGGRPRDVLSVTGIGPIGPIRPLAGLLIDDWTEGIPKLTTTTGVSLRQQQPTAQAAQSLLLAVPETFATTQGDWTVDD